MDEPIIIINNVVMSFQLPKRLHYRLRHGAFFNNLSMSEIVRRGIIRELDEMDIRQEQEAKDGKTYDTF